MKTKIEPRAKQTQDDVTYSTHTMEITTAEKYSHEIKPIRPALVAPPTRIHKTD